MLIYFAGPLFSAAERKFNLRLTERLEAMGSLASFFRRRVLPRWLLRSGFWQPRLP